MMKGKRLLSALLLTAAALAGLLLALSPSQAQAQEPSSQIDWPYPRYDLANTAAVRGAKWQLLEEPEKLWETTPPEGYSFHSLFPVAADIDNDARAEFIIGVSNFKEGDYWLYAFNVEDGSILWKRQIGDWFHWSAPTIVDINNDGQLDVVLATNSEVLALKGDDASLIWSRPFTDSGLGMTVADVNGDGLVEIIINDYGDPKKIHLLNGQDGSLIWQRETGGSAYNIPTVGDINGDGRPEILSHNHLYNPSRERLLVWDQDGNELWSYQASPSPEQEAQAPPELGWVPDFGYISTTIADFNADGKIEIGWGTRCHYYLLDGQGKLLWRVPTVQGYGIVVYHHADGTIEPDVHGTGGPTGFAAAVGNIDGDPALEILLSFKPEYRADVYEITSTTILTHVTPANEIWALDGQDGSIQWVFEGEYPSEYKLEQMYEPILVDLTGDGLLDVLVLSVDGHLYAIKGSTGEQLKAYSIKPASGFWYAEDLTFVGYNTWGIVLYIDNSDGLSKLHALRIASRKFEVYLPVVMRGW